MVTDKTINEVAEALTIDTQQLFVRAHAMFGMMWHQGSPSDTYQWWRKSGTVPMAVQQYCRYQKAKLCVSS